MGGIISGFLAIGIGVVYPAYRSFKALETPSSEDDTMAPAVASPNFIVFDMAASGAFTTPRW